MNTESNEQLSAFIDGEMPLDAQAGLSARLLQDRVLRRKMTRYRQIGDTLRQTSRQPVDASDIVTRMQADLAQEPYLLAPNKSRKSRAIPRISHIAWGAGLAATVAMVAIGLAPRLLNPDHAFTPQQTVTVTSPAHLQSPLVATTESDRTQTASTWRRLPPAQLQQLDRYLIEHNEYANPVWVGRPSVHVNFMATQHADQ